MDEGGRQSRLPITSTNSATDSKGKAFGLEGNQAVPVIVSIVVSAGMFLVFTASGDEGVGWFRLLTCVLPFAATLTYTLIFLHNKPPRYRDDVIDQMLTGKDFNVRPRRGKTQLEHPLLLAHREIEQRKQKKFRIPI